MSSFLGIPSLLVLVLVLVSSSLSLSSPNFSSKVTSAELNGVCSRTHNPSYCLGVLQSNPETGPADLNGLCLIAIDSTKGSARGTINMLLSLVKSTTNPTLKGRYSTCVGKYDEAVGFLDEAAHNLETGDFLAVNGAASTAMVNIDDCAAQFGSLPKDPSPLPTKNKNMGDLTNIISVISDILGGESLS